MNYKMKKRRNNTHNQDKLTFAKNLQNTRLLCNVFENIRQRKIEQMKYRSKNPNVFKNAYTHFSNIRSAL